MDRLTPAGRDSLRLPHPEIVHVLDPRPLLDEAASIGARYSTAGCSLPNLSPLACLWPPTLVRHPRNIGRRLAEIADELNITVHVAEPA